MSNYKLKNVCTALRDCSVKEEYSKRPWSDQLYVNVIVIEGPKTWCMISVDVTELNTHETLKIRKLAAKLLDINYKNIWITFTHTHAAWYGVSSLNNAKLSDAILAAVEIAKKTKSQPINSVAIASIDTANKYTINRRAYVKDVGCFSIFQSIDSQDDGNNVDVTQAVKKELGLYGADNVEIEKLPKILLDGQVDGILQLILFGLNTTPVAGIVRFSAHPVILSSGYYKPHFSRDYCGVLCDSLSKMWKCPILFLQGAAGNQKTRHTVNTVEQCECLGKALAAELRPAKVKIKFEKIDGIDIASKTIRCSIHDYIMCDKQERAKRIKKLTTQLKSLVASTDYLQKFKKLLDKKRALEDVELNISELGYLVDEDIAKGYCRTEMSAVKIGRVVIVSGNHELANFFSLRLYEQFSADDLVVGAYTNGSDGYVLDSSDFRRGGYEQAASVIAPENAEKIFSAAKKIVAKWKCSHT